MGNEIREMIDKIKNFDVLVENRDKPLSFKNIVNQAAKQLKKNYHVKIDDRIPAISVIEKMDYRSDREKPDQEGIPVRKRELYTYDELHTTNIEGVWYAQGEEAQDILDEIPKGVSRENYVLWLLDSSGQIRTF